MRYCPLRQINFIPGAIQPDLVIKGIHQEGAESYRDDIEDLLEKYKDQLQPYACWREVRVKNITETTIDLCGHSMEDAYLAKRLQGIRTIKVFLAGIGDDTWNQSMCLTDSLDQYLFSQIMSTCFNLAFRQVCIDMTRSMPKGAKLFMDNPGIDGGWDLKHQEELMNILFFEAEPTVSRPGNPFSFSGIVYTSNTSDSTRENIRYMSGDQLVSILYQTAGIMPPEDI